MVTKNTAIKQANESDLVFGDSIITFVSELRGKVF
jgi:hypothetical protein